MQAYSLKRENGVTPIVGLHRIPAKKHPYGALAEAAPVLCVINTAIGIKTVTADHALAPRSG